MLKTSDRLKLVKDTQVDVGRNFEAKGQRHHGEVQGVDAVDLFERVRVVGPHVRLVGLLGRLVQVVVLLNQLLQLDDAHKDERKKVKLVALFLESQSDQQPPAVGLHLRLDVGDFAPRKFKLAQWDLEKGGGE